MTEDSGLEVLQLGARLDAELVDEMGAGALEGSQRLGLPPGSVEGEHELAPEPLPQRMVPDQGFELCHQLPGSAQGEVGFDSGFDGGDSHFAETPDLGVEFGMVDTAVGIAEPEVQPRDESCPGRRGLRPQELCTVLDALLEGEHVECGCVDLDQIAIASSEDGIRSQNATEVVDVALDRGPGRFGRFSGPDGVDEVVLRDDPVGRTEQNREHHLLAETTQLRLLTVEFDGDRAESPVPHDLNIYSPRCFSAELSSSHAHWEVTGKPPKRSTSEPPEPWCTLPACRQSQEVSSEPPPTWWRRGSSAW